MSTATLQYRTDRTRPGLGMTYEGYEPGLLERVLPLVDFIEVTPDTIAEVRGEDVWLNPSALAELKAIGSEATIVVHGVGLTIGSHEGFSGRYIKLLDALLDQVDVTWHSEHLAYNRVDGEPLGTMLPLPRTDEVLAIICRRVEWLHERYGLPFLLENIIHLLPDPGGEWSPAGFFNAIAVETGCGFLLDAYNLECDAHNDALDVDGYLAELDMSRVREIHVANGMENGRFMLDIHSRRTRESTIALAHRAIGLADGAVDALTFELVAEAVPVLGHDEIVAELRRLRNSLDGVDDGSRDAPAASSQSGEG